MELLARYLERTDRRVYALVRGADDHEVAARVRHTLLSLFGADHPYAERVVAVQGDITRPSLGLPGKRDRLYRRVVHPLLVRANSDRRYRRVLARSEIYFPYFSMAVVYDDRRSRAALRGAGIKPPSLPGYFDRLVEFALAAEWGRRPIPRAKARASQAPSSTHRESAQPSSIGGEMMTSARLSALDASFLAVETPTAHMHVGWAAVLSAPAEGRLPHFAELRDHIELRLRRAPRYRQKLASIPLGLHAPEWIDDPCFSVDRHVYRAPGPLSELADEVMSMPLRRDRPLWEIWICEDIPDKQIGLVGKVHHCMVDGIAAVELGSMLLDSTPEPEVCEPDDWLPAPQPGAERLLVRGVRDLVGGQVGLLRRPLRAVTSPARAARQTATDTLRMTRALTRSLLRAAPASLLNRPLSPLRHLAWTERPLADLQAVKRAHGTTGPRTFNLVVSNIPGPAEQLYMLGCPLQATYPVVPLADHHAVSVGMTTVHGRACFGVYADREALPDADTLAHDIDDAITELLTRTHRASGRRTVPTQARRNGPPRKKTIARGQPEA